MFERRAAEVWRFHGGFLERILPLLIEARSAQSSNGVQTLLMWHDVYEWTIGWESSSTSWNWCQDLFSTLLIKPRLFPVYSLLSNPKNILRM